MKMKIKWLILILIFLSTILLASAVIADTQFINDSKVYLASYDAHSPGGIIREGMMLKQFSGDLTLAWCFDTDEAKPKNPQLRKPHNVTTEYNYTCEYEFDYILTPEKRAWCYIEYIGNISNGTSPYNVTIFNHTFLRGNVGLKIIWWDKTVEEEYIDFPLDLTPIHYDYQGMDTCYVAKNVPVVSGVLYETRFDLQLKPKLGEVSGKYFKCGYPSSYGRNIAQAELDGKFYCLDPWFNVSFSNKFPINCTNMDDGIPLVINGSSCINIDGELQCIWTACQGEGTALYLIDETNYTDYMVANDTDALPFEVEKGNGTSSNPISIWSGYTMVHHMTDGAPDTLGNYDGTVDGPILNSSGEGIGDGYTFDASAKDEIILDNLYNDAPPATFSIWIKTMPIGDTVFLISDKNGLDGGYFYIGIDEPNGYVWIYQVSIGKKIIGSTDITDGELHNVVVTASGSSYLMYIDGELDSFSNTDHNDGKWYSGVTSTKSRFGLMKQSVELWPFNGLMDELTTKNSVRTAAQINQSYQNVIGTSGYGDTLPIESQVSDTCTYVSGTWLINDTCIIQDDTDVGGNPIIITGVVQNNASITNFASLNNQNSFINIEAGAVN